MNALQRFAAEPTVGRINSMPVWVGPTLGAVIAALGLLYAIRAFRLNWGVRLLFRVKPAEQPPVEIEIVNHSKVLVQLKAIRVRRHSEKRAITELPLDYTLGTEQTGTVSISDQLNEYFWQQIDSSLKVPMTEEWQEQRELLDISLCFDSRARAGATDWVTFGIVRKVHPTHGGRVDRVERY
jgi:hypothetical protein